MGGKNKARQLKSRIRQRRRTHALRRTFLSARERDIQKELASTQTRNPFPRTHSAFRDYYR